MTASYRGKVPSVTDVLEATGVTPSYDGMSPYYLDRGSRLHAAVARELRGDGDLIVDEDIASRVQAARLFVSAMRLRPVLVEREMVSERLGVAGTMDALLRDHRGRLVLLDWKATMYEEWHQVQAAAYWMLASDAAVSWDGIDAGEVAVARIGVVTLGGAVGRPHWVEDRARMVAVFADALRRYKGEAKRP